MIIIDCEQGSEEWFKHRCGVPSASRFKDIMTEPRAKKDKEAGVLSDTAESYMCELLAQLLTGNVRNISAKSLEWGNTEEPKALADYSFDCKEEVKPVGFILRDDRLVGCSPDGLVGTSGGVEIKSPENPAIHIKTLIRNEMPKEHMPQVQGGLWLAEREWWDFASFRNDLPPGCNLFTKRIYRDEDYIRDMAVKVNRFVHTLHERYQALSHKAA